MGRNPCGLALKLSTEGLDSVYRNSSKPYILMIRVGFLNVHHVTDGISKAFLVEANIDLANSFKAIGKWADLQQYSMLNTKPYKNGGFALRIMALE